MVGACMQANHDMPLRQCYNSSLLEVLRLICLKCRSPQIALDVLLFCSPSLSFASSMMAHELTCFTFSTWKVAKGIPTKGTWGKVPDIRRQGVKVNLGYFQGVFGACAGYHWAKNITYIINIAGSLIDVAQCNTLLHQENRQELILRNSSGLAGREL